MDELAVSPRIRWRPETNEIVGTCWNHKEVIRNYIFDQWLRLESFKHNLEIGKIHLANEALVLSLCKIDSQIVPITILVILIKEIIQHVYYIFQNKMKYAKLVNIATDGDTNRRKALNELRIEINEFEIFNDFECFDLKLI